MSKQLPELLFAPTEPAAAPEAPPPTETPSAPASAAAGASQSSAPAAAPSESAPSAPTQAATPAAPPSWLDGLRSQGVDLGTDEAKAQQQLVQTWHEAQQLRQLAPYANEYMTQREQYNAWRQAQAQYAQQQAQQTQQQEWYQQLGWNPPEWNPAWTQLLTQDEQGNVVAAKGAPPDLVPKYHAYQAFRREQFDKFMQNPHTFLEPTVRHLAAQIAQQTVQQHLGAYQERNSAQQFVEQNAPWLYERDPSGQIQYALTYNPQSGRQEPVQVLSPWGERFRDYVSGEAQRQMRRGYSDLEEQKTNAMRQVQLDYSLAQLQQMQGAAAAAPGAPAAAPQTPREAANQAFLEKNGKQPTGKRPAGNSAPTTPRVTGENLQEILAQRFKEQGITSI